ncbi:efflux RND transporter permease subunit [Marinomonas balearica]|uniref:Multidrug efflux pump subunit AcrB n=1 Tax=Marinomonas balearica TaxID=491947 RepID=A0A4R6MEH5_9GAMM|nr:efflux RND transporter permease subunit [Marinomonas balearica]TDO99846.1 multidrug efflux pump subunit AcrB [Marinomonas balearica]
MSVHTQHRGIIPWFAANPVAANLLMLLVIALGIINVGSLNKKSFPTLPPNGIDVSVSYDSGSAKANEESIAIPIEQKLQSVEGIKNMMSSSSASGASVNVEVKDDYELEDVFTDIKDSIGEMSFPSEADPASVTKDTRSELAMIVQMFGDTDRRTLQMLANDLKTDLLSDQEINSVSISGALDPIMKIDVDRNLLDAYGLALEDLSTAINAESSSASVATLSNKDIYLTISASEQDYFKSQFAAIPIKSFSDGGQLFLGDVATIKDTFDDSEFVLSRFNQKNSLALRINTVGQDDIINTVEATYKIIDQWKNNNRLPSTVSLVSWNDRSESIDQRLELMVKNALTGIFLVFVLLAVFLNITVAFWVAMGLPFIFFGTLFAMGTETMGLSLNLITTFGFILALGIVVDDAVVVGESIYDVRSKEGDTLGNTIKGTMNVAVPTLFGVFTTVAAFWALSNIDGRLGKIYSQFAIVVAICLVLSVIESKIILPAHLSHINTRKNTPKNVVTKVWSRIQQAANSGLMLFSEYLYRPTINFSLTHRYAILIGFISIFALVMSMPFTGEIRTSFFPRIPGDTVRASLTMHSDVSYGQTQKALLEIEQKAYQTDALLSSSNNLQGELSDIKNWSGIKNIETRAKGDQEGDFRIELQSDAPYTPRQFSAKWQQLVGSPEGVKSLRIRSAAETVDALYIEVTSHDSFALDGALETLISELNKIPAVTGIEKFDAPLEERIAIDLNEQGRLLGLTTSNLASQITSNFDGDTVQKYQRDNDEIEVKLGYSDAQEKSPSEVIDTQITLDSGTQIPLNAVASLSKTEVQTRIFRIDGKRSYYLSAEVDKDILSSTEVVDYLQQSVMPNIEKQFASVTFDFGGEAEEQAETESSLLEMFLLALLVIYALLAIPLKSYAQPLIIMMAIPFGIIGALLGHWMNDLSISIFSLNGILALSGVVVNDSLLLVSRFNDLRKETIHVKKAIVMTCQGRLRAVLLTSFTTFAGLIPILWETSRQAQALIPAAVSLGYGIMFATFITLILIPVLLLIKEDIHSIWIKITKRTTKATTHLVS